MPATSRVMTSANGTVSQMPLMPSNVGKKNMKIDRRPMPRSTEMTSEYFACPTEVK